MSKWNFHLLNFEQVRSLEPLRKAIIWLEEEDINGGPLHGVVVEQNYSDQMTQSALEGIRSGDYEKYLEMNKISLGKKQLKKCEDIAEALMALSPEMREMVCQGNCITKALYDKIFNVPQIVTSIREMSSVEH